MSISVRKMVIGILTASLVTAGFPQLEHNNIYAQGEQTLFINEVMAANTETLRDGDLDDPDSGSLGGAYSDWIEIYNSSSTAIDLSGYTLSDSSATWKFPQGLVPAKGYILVWASDKNKVAKDGQLHSNFKLSASGETITLKNDMGVLVDTVTTIALGDDQSYGRKTDGASEMVLYSKSSPLKSNINSAATIAVKAPVFSHKGGFYTEAFNLNLSTDEDGVKIYYTLDGSDPVPQKEGTYEFEDSLIIKSRNGDPNVLSMIKDISTDKWNMWQAPIGYIFKCSTIKAVAIREDGTKSKIVTHSYFVDKDMKTRYDVPVISLVTDRTNLFDSTTGIYVNGNFEKKGDEWERPVHIEFFEKDGTLAFSQYSGIRINGGFSRKIPQKSFRLYADHDYDDTDKYKYEIFPGLKKKGNGKKLDSFSRIILRNGGNDCSWTGTMFRDALIQGLVSHLKLDTLAYRPSVVFLDGEYWGIYNIRERYDGEYLESHYNIDKDKAVMLDVWEYPSIQEGEKGDEKSYQNDIINYLKTHSITDKDTYEYIKTKMDIENYIDYNIAEIFSGNYDWPGNNMSIWRYKTDDGNYHPEAPYGQDGRWRWMLRDTDFGFGLYEKSVTFDTLSFATADVPAAGDAAYANAPWAVFLLKTLLKNDEFRNNFINSFADQMNSSFEPERVNQKIDQMKSAIEAEMVENADRWRVLSITKFKEDDLNWYDNIDYIKDYANKRPQYVRQHIVNKFKNNGVAGTAQINISTKASEGYVKVNTIDIKSSTPGIKDSENWTGVYFKGVPVTLQAVPAKGYIFDHWEGSSIDGSTSESITLNMEEGADIKAVFKTNETNDGYKLSGYIKPDFASDYADIKAGFKVEVVGKGISAITDSKGYFELINLPENVTGYSLKISKANYLSREVQNVVVSGDKMISSQNEPLLIWGGDIAIGGTQDDSINMLDVMQVAKAFNTISGDERFNVNVDLNRDEMINIGDVMVIARHFNADTSSYTK